MAKNRKKKDKKRKKDGKKKEKMTRSDWKEVSEVEKKNRHGEAKAILPSPYENERIILRKREAKAENGEKCIEINAVRENAEGEKKLVGKKVLKEGGELAKEGEKPYKAEHIQVKEEYQGSKVATSMSELARKVVERESGDKKPIYEVTLKEKGRKYLENRGIEKEKFRKGAGAKAFLPEDAEKKGLYIEQGREKKALEPEKAVEKIEKEGQDHITRMIEKGEIQKSNYKEIIDRLKDDNKTMEVFRLKRKMEKEDTEGLNM